MHTGRLYKPQHEGGIITFSCKEKYFIDCQKYEQFRYDDPNKEYGKSLTIDSTIKISCQGKAYMHNFLMYKKWDIPSKYCPY